MVSERVTTACLRASAAFYGLPMNADSPDRAQQIYLGILATYSVGEVDGELKQGPRHGRRSPSIPSWNGVQPLVHERYVCLVVLGNHLVLKRRSYR